MRSYDVDISEAYSEPRTSEIELFAKTIFGWKPLPIFTKNSTLDNWEGYE